MSGYSTGSQSRDVSIERLEEELKSSVCKESEVLSELEYMKQLMMEVSAENDELINDMHIMMEENEDLKIELDEGLDRENQMAAEMEVLRQKLEKMEEKMEARSEQNLDPEIVSEAVKNARKTMGHKVKQVLSEKRQMEMMVEQLSMEIEIVRDSMNSVVMEKKIVDQKVESLQSAMKRCRCEARAKAALPAGEKNPEKMGRRLTNISRRLSNAGSTALNVNARRNTFHAVSASAPKDNVTDDDLDEPADVAPVKLDSSKTKNMETKWQGALTQGSGPEEDGDDSRTPKPSNLAMLKKQPIAEIPSVQSESEAEDDHDDDDGSGDDDSEPFDASSQGSDESSIASESLFSTSTSKGDVASPKHQPSSQSVSFPSTTLPPTRRLERRVSIQSSRRSLCSSGGNLKRSKHRVMPYKKNKSFRKKSKAPQPPQWLERLFTSFAQAET